MKRILMISYDLNKGTPEEYAAIAEYLEKIGKGGSSRPLESVFFVITDMSVYDVSKGMQAVLTNAEGVLRNGTRWVIAPIKLSESTYRIAKDKADWWKDAESKGW